jgi:hypothetical protein
MDKLITDWLGFGFLILIEPLDWARICHGS